MPCFVPEDHTKLPSNHCKSLPAIIRDACAQCHGSCLRTASSLSSHETPDDYLDDKHVIILEIRSRAMKARPRAKDSLFTGSLSWSLSPTTGTVIIAPKGKGGGEEESKAEDGEESEAFFSVKSCFSRCSSDGGSEKLKEFRRRSIFEEFKHCEGWPFGLSRRASMLPPLPSVPSDSWMWHKKKPVTKTCTLN